jgi:hypothetical protein
MLLPGMKHARSRLDVSIRVLEYFERQAAVDAAAGKLTAWILDNCGKHVEVAGEVPGVRSACSARVRAKQNVSNDACLMRGRHAVIGKSHISQKNSAMPSGNLRDW